MLYHVDFHIEYPASMSQKDFFSIWHREAEAALGARKADVMSISGNRIALSDSDDSGAVHAGDVGVGVVAAESFSRGLIP
jgi:hypothetical protein